MPDFSDSKFSDKNITQPRGLLPAAAVLIMAGVFIIVILYFAALAKQQLSTEMLDRYRQELLTTVVHQSERLGDRLKAITGDLAMLSTHTEFINDHEAESRRRLKEFYDKNQEFIVAGYRMDKYGVLKYVEGADQAGEGINISDQAHVKTLFGTQKTVISRSFKAVEGYYAIAIHVPVFRGKQIDGSIATLVRWDTFHRWFDHYRTSPDSYTMILDKDEKIISHPNSAYVGSPINDAPSMIKDGVRLPVSFLFSDISAVLSGPFFNHQQFVVASHPFSFENETYSLVRAAPYADIVGPIDRLSLLILKLAAGALLIIFVSLLFFFYLFWRGRKNWMDYQQKVRQKNLERKLAEQERNETHQTLLTVLDSIDATIYAADMKTFDILFMNKHMKDIFGADGVGQKCHLFFRGESGPCRECSNDRLVDKKGNPAGVHIWEGQNPLNKKWYYNYDRAVKWIDGRLARIQIATDITRKKEMEKKLQRAEKMEALGTLAGGVAHDLNNVLSGIVTYPELLLMDINQGHPFYEPLKTIHNSGQKAAEIVNDLLTLARRGVTVSEVVNLNDIVTDYLESPEYGKLAAYHPDIRFTTHLARSLANINGSPIHLRKTIMNLVSNAVEAHTKQGHVTISTWNQELDAPLKGYEKIIPGEYVIFQIIDEGTGIEPEDINRIFEPFYTKKVMGRSGTGLGMAVVWGTVQDHNGYICIDSRKNEGTTMTVYFPATTESTKKPEDKVPLEALIGDGEKILVIDDVPEQIQIASNILNKLNYRVTAVQGGEKALDYLKYNATDLILLDMIMAPGIDGLETYMNILKIHPNQRAIIASGYTENQRVKKAMDLGAGAYIRKPYRLESLGFAVKSELCRK